MFNSEIQKDLRHNLTVNVLEIDYRTAFLVAAIGGLVTALVLHVGVSDPRYLEQDFTNHSVKVLPE